jgi:hypothetical protein
MSLVFLAAGGYLAWHFRERISALAWIKTKKMDNNEP